MERQKVLILGATGMLGHVLFTELSGREELDVRATVRRWGDAARFFGPALADRVRGGVEASDFDSVLRVLSDVRPEVVVNGIGIVKQLPEATDPVASIKVNSLFPHRLALACRAAGARLVHIGTDCVFSGRKGRYAEEDAPDAEDLYGRSKLLGEVTEPPCVTLRTSLVGHELSGRNGLVEWFLGREGKVKGFARAVFTGFPTVELARIIALRVLPNRALEGLYHVASEPIAKYDLLSLVARAYGRKISIERDEAFRCDRSLDPGRFRAATGYVAPPWTELVERMHDHFVRSPLYAGRRGGAGAAREAGGAR